MIDIDELKRKIKDQKSSITELEQTLNISQKEEELAKLEELTFSDNFWSDQNESSKTLARISELKSNISNFNKIKDNIDSSFEMISLITDEEDNSLISELEKEVNLNEQNLENFKIITLLNGKYDECNAIITIHPGARRY